MVETKLKNNHKILLQIHIQFESQRCLWLFVQFENGQEFLDILYKLWKSFQFNTIWINQGVWFYFVLETCLINNNNCVLQPLSLQEWVHNLYKSIRNCLIIIMLTNICKCNNVKVIDINVVKVFLLDGYLFKDAHIDSKQL